MVDCQSTNREDLALLREIDDTRVFQLFESALGLTRQFVRKPVGRAQGLAPFVTN